MIALDNVSAILSDDLDLSIRESILLGRSELNSSHFSVLQVAAFSRRVSDVH